MGSFNEQERQVIGTHVTTAKLMTNKNNVQVTCDNNENGLAIWNMFKRVYPDFGYNKANNAWIPGAFLFGDYKTFRVLTGNRDSAQDLLDEINDCIQQYGYSALNNTHGLMGGGSGSGGNTYNYVTYQSDEDSKKTFSGNATTYIIICAAVILILLLLWNKK